MRHDTRDVADIEQHTRPMTAHHASIDAYLVYRRAFGTVGFTPDLVDTYFAALEREVRRQYPGPGPIGIGWSITIVTASKPEAIGERRAAS